MNENKIINGDCLEVMKGFQENFIDTIITDPPYGLKFMGKKWDYKIPSIDVFKEMLRIAKPGAILLCFGGTKTFHRIACNIEDAGWLIRDTLMWVYGSGFPKSLNISKAIDKKFNKKRTGMIRTDGKKTDSGSNIYDCNNGKDIMKPIYEDGEPITDDAKKWNGWGTGLKPAYEPIIMAMKPIEKNFVNNALKWNVSGINIDGCLIGDGSDKIKGGCKTKGSAWNKGLAKGVGKGYAERIYNQGRYPANIIFDEEAGKMLDEQSGILTSVAMKGVINNTQSQQLKGLKPIEVNISGSIGGASRFFYCAKASNKERGKINKHPTVKPIKLLKYLCELTSTPDGGIILDPFFGSGSLGIAALLSGRNFIGIEKSIKYIRWAKIRIEAFNIRRQKCKEIKNKKL